MDGPIAHRRRGDCPGRGLTDAPGARSPSSDAQTRDVCCCGPEFVGRWCGCLCPIPVVSDGQSAPTAWLLWSPGRSAIDDLPDTRDQIPARGRLLFRRVETEAASASRGRFVPVPCRPIRLSRFVRSWLPDPVHEQHSRRCRRPECSHCSRAAKRPIAAALLRGRAVRRGPGRTPASRPYAEPIFRAGDIGETPGFWDPGERYVEHIGDVIDVSSRLAADELDHERCSNVAAQCARLNLGGARPWGLRLAANAQRQQVTRERAPAGALSMVR